MNDSDIMARKLAASRNAVFFTGAGISTESGIPDFRSPGGVWSRYQPVYYDEFLTSHDARLRYWAMKREFYDNMKHSAPNPAHMALSRFHSLGLLKGLITQNIDGLHQASGLPDSLVIELHGTNRSVDCITCGKRHTAEEITSRLSNGETVPRCSCGGWLKPATISFGQQMPQDKISRAGQLSRRSDVFIVIGSSLVVHPAAAMPEIAKSSGAWLAIVNRDPTPLDSIADLVVDESAGVFMSKVLATVETLSAQ